MHARLSSPAWIREKCEILNIDFRFFSSSDAVFSLSRGEIAFAVEYYANFCSIDERTTAGKQFGLPSISQTLQTSVRSLLFPLLLRSVTRFFNSPLCQSACCAFVPPSPFLF